MNPLRDTKGIGKITIIVLILIVAASIYLGQKVGTHYYAYYDLQWTMQHWIEKSLTRTSYDRASLISHVMEKIRKHNIPLKEGDLKIEYNHEELRLRISAKYEVEVEFPGYAFILDFRPSGEHQTTPI